MLEAEDNTKTFPLRMAVYMQNIYHTLVLTCGLLWLGALVAYPAHEKDLLNLSVPKYSTNESKHLVDTVIRSDCPLGKEVIAARELEPSNERLAISAKLRLVAMREHNTCVLYVESQLAQKNI